MLAIRGIETIFIVSVEQLDNLCMGRKLFIYFCCMDFSSNFPHSKSQEIYVLDLCTQAKKILDSITQLRAITPRLSQRKVEVCHSYSCLINLLVGLLATAD